MATTQQIKPANGILNVEGVIQTNGKNLITRYENLTISKYKIKALLDIPTQKVIVAIDYDSTSKLIVADVLSNLNQTILGVSNSYIGTGLVGTITHKGILKTNLNGVGKTIGDSVFSNETGDLTLFFDPTYKYVGTLLSTTINADVLIDINGKVSDDYALTSLTQPQDDNSTNIATTEYVVSGLKKAISGYIWQLIDCGYDNTNWQSGCYGNGIFVAVATTGTNRVMRSIDNGKTWTAYAAPEANSWSSVTYGNGLFVAVASSGTNRVMTSPDGITWTSRTAAEANPWFSVAYGNGTFVAVAYDGTNRVMTSPDGITWTSRNAAEANSWYSVTYGNGTFVAVASDGTNRVMTSPDGITWTAYAAAEANAWTSVTYGNGTFVAVSQDGSQTMRSTNNGTTWTPNVININDPTLPLSIAYGDGKFVIVSSGYSYFNLRKMLHVSNDGKVWTKRYYNIPNTIATFNSIFFGKNTFIAISGEKYLLITP